MAKTSTLPPLHTFTEGGMTLGYRDAGAGMPLVMLSGWGVGSVMGEASVGALRQRGLRVITIDVPGTGAQRPASAFIYIPRLAKLVANLLRHLQLHEVTIVGHSFGSLVAQDMAMNEDDVVGKLVLVSPLAPLGSVAPDLGTAMSTFNRLLSGQQHILAHGPLGVVKAMFGPELEHELNDLSKPATVATLSGQVWAASRWTGWAGWGSKAGQIYQPTLLIHGEHDPLSPPAASRRLAGMLKHVQLEIQDCGYMPLIEQAEVCLPRIAHFAQTA
ncbi:MAG: alpha/beta hydrolase [Alphaproteobacteria bacterium]